MSVDQKELLEFIKKFRNGFLCTANPSRPLSPQARPFKKPKNKDLRGDAIDRGDSKYFGSACRHGHDGWRYSVSGGCCECQKKHSAAWSKKVGYRHQNRWNKDNPETRKKLSLSHYHRHKNDPQFIAKSKEYKRRYYLKKKAEQEAGETE